MNEDDKWDGLPLPTRTGVAQGKSFENRMLADAPSIGTKMRTFDNGSGQTSVLMRTRAGMPEFITTTAQVVQEVVPCVKGHFVEGLIENRVVFEPNESDDSNVRVFSTDYLFSRITKLAKEIKGIVAGKQFKFILTQGGIGSAPGVPKRNAPVESGSRTYHPAVVAYEEVADEAGNGEPRGLHFEIHRFKDLKFKFSVQGTVVTYTFANAAGTLPMVTNVGCMNKDAEELGFDTLYRARNVVDTLTAVKLKSKKTGRILLEFSGGVPEAFPPPEAGKEADRLKVVDENNIEALDLSKVANYGQAWHGKLTNVGVRTVVDGIPSVVTPKGYIPPTSGDVTYIRSPLAVAREVTNPPVTDPLLLAAGAKFNDYALLFGADGRYSTTSSWNIGLNRFVHFDATGFARVIGVEVTSASNTSITARFLYRKPLWDIAPADDFPLNSQLGSVTATVSLYAAHYMNPGSVYAGFRINQSPAGDKIAVMVLANFSKLETVSFSHGQLIAEVFEVSINSTLNTFVATQKWRIADPVVSSTARPNNNVTRAYAYSSYSSTDNGNGTVNIVRTDYGTNSGTWWNVSAGMPVSSSTTHSFLACARYTVSGTLTLDVVQHIAVGSEAKESWSFTYTIGSTSWNEPGQSEPALPTVSQLSGYWSSYGVGAPPGSVTTTPATAQYTTKYCGITVWEYSTTTGTPEFADGTLAAFPVYITNTVSRIVKTKSTSPTLKVVGGGKVATEVKTYGSYNPVTEELAVSDTPIAFS